MLIFYRCMIRVSREHDRMYATRCVSPDSGYCFSTPESLLPRQCIVKKHRRVRTQVEQSIKEKRGGEHGHRIANRT